LIRILTLIFAITALTAVNVYAGLPVNETDTGGYQLAGFYDLRDRESFIQITNTDSGPVPRTIHIQVFNVANLCNENNFFDVYTGNDTHVYNLRNIITNDGNPSGFVLPDGAYGIFIASDLVEPTLIGNLRIEDNNGYEYRTNLNDFDSRAIDSSNDIYSFNYNTESGVVLSDVVGIMLDNVDNPDEVLAADIVNILANFDIDIYDTNEVPFSCRNVVFACTDQNNPLLPALFEELSNCNVYEERGGCNANVASIEYGINEAIPSSKGAPLLCPNNVITDGIVQLTALGYQSNSTHAFVLFVGLNNGNGRGSMDAMWQDNDPDALPIN